MNQETLELSENSTHMRMVVNLDVNRLQQLAASIMSSNKLQEVAAYEELLYSPQSLSQVLGHILSSKQIYFVTSELLLRMLKTNSIELRLKISNSLTFKMGQSFNLHQYRARIIKIHKLVQECYTGVVAGNIDSLQRHQYNQALQIIAQSLSGLMNVCSEEQQPHLNLIVSLFPTYFQTQMQANNILGFLLNYEPFNSINQSQVILPQNVQLYKVLLNVMIQVIDSKENWDDTKYSQSQMLVNHRAFKNKFLGQWAQFAVRQAKIVFNFFLRNQTVLFSHLVLADVVKLLHRVLMFSHQSPNVNQWTKDKLVRFPQYRFPEGILRALGDDHTFFQILHQVYTKQVETSHQQVKQKITATKRTVITHQLTKTNQLQTPILKVNTVEICELMMEIYGRIFFLRNQYQKQTQNTIFMDNTNNQAQLSCMNLYLVKTSILSQMLQNPSLYLCQFLQSTSKSRQADPKQRYMLYYALVEITTQFLTYSLFVKDFLTNSETNASEHAIKTNLKSTIKHFLVNIIKFAQQFCLQQECWKIMYGQQQQLHDQEIFTELRHQETIFPTKVFNLLYQCHNCIDTKILNPKTQIEEIKEFYIKYFAIADQFLNKLEQQFTNKISKFITNDFSIEYSLIKEIIKSLPYVKVKENTIIYNRKSTNQKELFLQLQNFVGEEQIQKQKQKVLDYFEKFNCLVTNLNKAIQQKLINAQINKPNLSFFFYLIAVLIEHYLSNSNFYSKTSFPLIQSIKILLSVAFQNNQEINASSVFVFYEQIVDILSQKSLNSKQLLQIIFQTEEQVINAKLTSLQIGQIQQQSNFFNTKNKSISQRSLELVKKLMKSTIQRLLTTDIKELDAALSVLVKIFQEFYKYPLVNQFRYLKQFVENYMNTTSCLFSQSKILSRKLRLLALILEFLQTRANKFSTVQKSQTIISFNNICFMPFAQNKSIEALLTYFRCMDQMIASYQDNKLFVIDVFLCTIKDFINDINKNYRRLIGENVKFYETTKSLLVRILEVVELFGGEKWGTKFVGDQDQGTPRRKDCQSLYQDPQHSGDLFNPVQTVTWEDNERDDELPLLVEEYFYTWVKELGREEYEIENAGLWTKEKKDLNNKELIAIYAQYMHLTPNGKLPPLPKALVEKQRNRHLSNELQKENNQLPQLDDFSPNETRTTKFLVRLYLQNLYRLSNTNLQAIYPSIDYRLEYVRKWWDQIMIRGLRPQINVTFLYQKFVIHGHNAQMSENNRQLAELFYKIAKFYQNDHDFIDKCIHEPYRIHIVNQEQNFINKIGQITTENSKHNLVYESRKNYVNRILIHWQYNLSVIDQKRLESQNF